MVPELSDCGLAGAWWVTVEGEWLSDVFGTQAQSWFTPAPPTASEPVELALLGGSSVCV